MEYITTDDTEGIQYGRYLDALASFRHLLPSHVAEFAADESRFTLNDPRSLHDAWLESLTVQESRASSESPSCTSIELVLLGQQHDRHIVIQYVDVRQYSLRHAPLSDMKFHDAAHGDIFTHEVRVEDDGYITHEICFVTDSVFLVCCRDFKVLDRPIKREGEQEAEPDSLLRREQVS